MDRLLSDMLGTAPGEVRPVDAGPLGGIAQCSAAQGALGAMSVCAWVGDDNFGKFVWIGVSLSDAMRDTVTIRSQLESA
ncbi:hypothetical protein [Nocardia mangyaensis]|uniref:hypothetical protein n=1 Tax=Nocardia mangyaensis TaxID=2213200 RepID=UPI002674F87C|nr:hypothetical protein [Nocardia mangyaensis]MDO3646151.1 hypothetical protein [Nocardia mangyaensis]